jgi:hypothetical protein
MAKTSPTKRQPSNRQGLKPWPIWAAVVLALVVLAVIVIVATRDTASGGAEAAPEVSHVHGLGVNPADGALYAATHHGVFRIPEDGQAELVSTPRDTMGFTVVGEDHFLGSGHPAPQGDPLFEQGGRPLLGLIESTDAGRTWKPLSLLGEVDFHALEAAHGDVYGFDATSGRFLVSADGEEWDVRTDGVMMSDFAVDPDDADHLIALTDEGLAESTDGGRTWQPTDGPNVVFLSWHADDGLWGVDSDGRVFTRGAGGWEERSALPGQPQALVATGDAIYAAAVADGRTGVYVSDDGATWSLRYQDPEQ